MKNCFPVLLLFLFACHDPGARHQPVLTEQRWIQFEPFRAILDSAGVTGVILVFDTAANAYYTNDPGKCSIGHLPASTFKIPNSIIALETGVIAGDSTLIPWDGQPRRLKSWEQDLYFRDAFHVSCVPCYQDIARQIGAERMREYLEKLDYGEMVVDPSVIDVFWLEGGSRISPLQQVGFLKRFYYSQLPISKNTESIMKRLMVIEENEDGRLSGKTGWSIREGNNNGWFVGYLEKGEKVYFVATNIDPMEDFNMDMFAVIRREISLRALELID